MSSGSDSAVREGWLPQLSGDGRLLFATCGVRTFAYGFLSVMLGLYLSAEGLDAQVIGGVFTAAMVGAALMTVTLTAVADRLGRRRILAIGAALMAGAGTVFALTDNVALLIIAAVIGTISPSGKEVGPFLSVEQAILPQTTRDKSRTKAFVAYNIVGSLAGALGALMVGLPHLLGLEQIAGYQSLVWCYVGAAVVMFILFSRLSSRAEAVPAAPSASRYGFGLHHSRGIVLRLAGLFAIDAFAGGFVVQGLMAYWLHLRYGVDAATLGSIFFGTNILAAISFMAAVPVARRIGLLNTMVFTHLPSNVLLLMVPFMPSVELAVAVLLGRNLLAQLDIPTRQSYIMAVVKPDERSAAAGLTSVARNAASAIAPAFAGITLAVPALGLPFLISGSLRIVYDFLILATFRRIRPPEEAAHAAAVLPADNG